MACISQNRKQGHQQRIKVREMGLGFEVAIQGGAENELEKLCSWADDLERTHNRGIVSAS